VAVRILILEDDPLIALDLAAIVEAQGHEVVGSFPSVAAAAEHLDEPVDFALLDIDVADGKSFGLATALRRRDIPFAFVSGSHRSEIPAYLANVLLIPKPYREAAIVQSLPRERHAA
jgi:DNA-binding LytR/AlgR family response regulator